MPAKGNAAPTLMDVANRLDPEGKIAAIVEMLSKTNEILEDMVVIEGNLPTGHKSVIRTGIPKPAWRKLNYGVKAGKSTTVPVTDTCGMLETYSKIDKAVADLNGNTAEFRLSEDKAFLEGMNQEMAETLFYGDTDKHPDRFMGLFARFNTTDEKKAASAANVIDAGGTAANNLTSAWLVAWGDQTVHSVYPKGSQAGLHHKDLGEVTLTDADGGEYQGYRTHYKWDLGLVVRDWRYVVHITNIDLATITDDKLIDIFEEASEALPNHTMGKPVFYMNRQLRTRLRRALRNAKNVHLTLDQAAGRKVISFDEIPVKRCDAITNTQAKVS